MQNQKGNAKSLICIKFYTVLLSQRDSVSYHWNMSFLFLLARVLFQSYIDLIKIENLLISIAEYWTGDQNYTVPVIDLDTRKIAVEEIP